MDNELIIERRGPVVRLTVNRPEVRNALSIAVTQRIAQTLRDLSRDRTVRVFVLTGAGDRVFVSGADVTEFREQLATPEQALNYDATAEQLQSALRAVPQPVIARIQGHAVGSGSIVAASCDFRIAVRTAKFGIPVAKFGFLATVPDTLRLVQLVGTAKAKWLLMTGQLIEAPEARAIGLIDQVVDADRPRYNGRRSGSYFGGQCATDHQGDQANYRNLQRAQQQCCVGGAVVCGNFSQRRFSRGARRLLCQAQTGVYG